jgi:hypothetical protein
MTSEVETEMTVSEAAIAELGEQLFRAGDLGHVARKCPNLGALMVRHREQAERHDERPA